MNDGDNILVGLVTTNMMMTTDAWPGNLPASIPPGGADGGDAEVMTVINYTRIGQYRWGSKFSLRSIPTYRGTHLSESWLPVAIGPKSGQSST